MKSYSVVFFFSFLACLPNTSVSAPGNLNDNPEWKINSVNLFYEPLAPKFWSTSDHPKENPLEEPLFPRGLPHALNITEHIEERAADRTNRWVTKIREPTITIHLAAGSKTAVIICPGGGYSGLAYDKEGHDIARWLNSLGVTGVVLKYRVKDYGQPVPGNDAQQAIALLRSRTDELGLDPKQIGIMGFSAGGHVASTAGTRFREIDINGQHVSTRPDFMILVYPVISMDRAITHLGSRTGLLGSDPSDELVEEFSNDQHVKVGARGFEPPTPCSQSRCASQTVSGHLGAVTETVAVQILHDS